MSGEITNLLQPMKDRLAAAKRWSEQRVAKCRMCGATSDRHFGTGAYRVAANHTRSTGHVVTVSRTGRIWK